MFDEDDYENEGEYGGGYEGGYDEYGGGYEGYGDDDDDFKYTDTGGYSKDIPEDLFEDDKPEFKEERDYWERVEKSTGFVSSENIKMMNEEEKFILSVAIQFKQINKELDNILGLNDLEYIKSICYKMGENIKYRNPTAYILGYYCLDKSGKNEDGVNTKNFKNIIKNIDNFEGVSVEDVLRYTLYWNKYLYKEEDD